ncbi:MAG: outer membrane protein [Vicinamibacterales bacterium]
MALFSAGTPPAAHAQEASGWYAGAQAGWQQIRFQPRYTFLLGGDDPTRFDNRQAGVQWDVLVGRRSVLSRGWALSIEGGVGFNRTKWELEIPDEPAALEYTMPYDVRVAIVPERRVSGRVAVFGSVGAGAGRVHEVKTSPSTSLYDVARTRPMLVAGGGLKVAVSTRAQLRVEYRVRQLARFEFDSVDPAGRPVEHIEDRPRSHAISAGVTFGF